MTTPTTSLVESILDNLTTTVDDLTDYTSKNGVLGRPSSWFLVTTKWVLRITCGVIILLCPWANYKLIQFFQTRQYHKESSAKWYIIFKAVSDTVYMLVSIPILFFLTVGIDIIHRNVFTCKFLTYLHYLADDLISIMLTLLCIDRLLRITCSYRLQTRFSLMICVITTGIFMIVNSHHMIRFQHEDGICSKNYIVIGDYDFDIYYSFIFTCISWTIVFITSINLTVSVYCDRTRRHQLKHQQQQQAQQQKISQIFSSGSDDYIGGYSDRVELIRSTDDGDDSTTVSIEPNNIVDQSSERDQQDNVDLQITICVLITSVIFLACNLPNFILYFTRVVLRSRSTSFGYIFVYISLFPLLIAHTISYFVFNHLAARFF